MAWQDCVVSDDLGRSNRSVVCAPRRVAEIYIYVIYISVIYISVNIYIYKLSACPGRWYDKEERQTRNKGAEY